MLDLNSILTNFQLEGTVGSIRPFGSGHIHKTYKVENGIQGTPNYLLQQINHQIFPNVAGLMNNISLVTTHLTEKVAALQPEVCDSVLTIIKTIHGQLFYQAPEDRSYWRVYLFLDGLTSSDLPTSTQQIYQCGKAFGTFINIMADFDVEQLHTTIPKFHSVPFRLANLTKAVNADRMGRKSEVQGEIEILLKLSEEMNIIENLGIQGKIPIRVTHNDTKFNNVLFDHKGMARSIVDLDTIMPGYLLHDFGDAIRASTNTLPEDGDNFSEVNIDLKRFQAFSQGFLTPLHSQIIPAETEQLPRACMLLPYLMGMRFLTDYLDGDNYYNIRYTKHNLIRAKNQIALVLKVKEQLDLLKEIVDDVLYLGTKSDGVN